MNDRTASLFSGLGVLVAVWIVVYWSWPVERAVVTSSGAEHESTIGDELPPAEAIRPPPVIERPPPTQSPVAPSGQDPPREPTPEPGPAGGVIPPEFIDYQIRAGDNFERIAQRVYGSTRHAHAISRANPLLDPRKLRVGRVIRVPVDPTNIQGRPVEAPTPEAPPPSPTIEYTVKSGDSLSTIARSFYGSVRHVDFLFEANRDRLRSRDDLRAGQVLLIPPLPAEAGGGRP
jgi:nucleoid-associated protein YgaU